MRPKDLVMDLFGDYIRYTGQGIRLGPLTRLLELFDVEPATSRVTLSRMRRDGWVATERQGREMSYRATTKLLEVLDEGRQRIFSPPLSPWSGQWTVVLYQIPESRRADREHLKRTLSWKGFGQLNPTTWISPRDTRDSLRATLDGQGHQNLHVFTMSTGTLDRDRDLARQCWQLDELAEEYHGFIDRCSAWTPERLDAISPEEALITRVRLVADYRLFPFRDPYLPTALQPKDWPGNHAYQAFVQTHQELAAPATSYALEVIDGPSRRPSTDPHTGHTS